MFEAKMHLSDEQLAILNGAQGATMAKVMQTIVMFGEIYGANELVPITHLNGHLVTSFGIGTMKPLFQVIEKLVDDEIKTKDYFTVNPRPLDYNNVKCNLFEKFVFNKVLYTKQDFYEKQLLKLGLKDKNAFTCANYLDEVGNKPKYGDILSWAESSSVLYANSVIGARTNRNSSMIELFGNILGLIPNYGLLLDEGRKAQIRITLRLSKLPDPQALGQAIGSHITNEVVYISGLDKHLGKELNDKAKAYLKDFGTSLASVSNAGLYHIDNLTPEAKKFGTKLLVNGYKTIVIDEVAFARDIEPIISKNEEIEPEMCFIGCPHLSFSQLNDWTKRIVDGLKAKQRKKVAVKTILATSPDVLNKFKETINYELLIDAGVKISCFCPYMYTSNPLTHKKVIVTNSNKLRMVSNSHFYSSDDILYFIVGKDEA